MTRIANVGKVALVSLVGIVFGCAALLGAWIAMYVMFTIAFKIVGL